MDHYVSQSNDPYGYIFTPRHSCGHQEEDGLEDCGGAPEDGSGADQLSAAKEERLQLVLHSLIVYSKPDRVHGVLCFRNQRVFGLCGI